ncbi:hypothetical protein KIPB_001817 [Kipferlia bialata]|uniref:Leucine-rich repeat-containing N-terminal plant-type domain-containing protein n=1 Tax=Kipferlia bialata TaxID=797122 RepID=A0A9K3GG80_9EUKA|nr:hypothetical protein KIPB_001817 [Kipferlia bialata]|eukprot:g1817.t1
MRPVLVVLLLVSLVFAQCTTERDALVDLYDATNGPEWTQANNWLSADPYCQWTGVTCDNSGMHVRNLNVSNFGLQGQIPDSIGCFPFMQYIVMANNTMSSTIPSSLQNLTNLKSLNLNNAGMVGTIPDALCNLEYVQFIWLTHNDLTGPIPSCVNENTFLKEWRTQYNMLDGSVPTEFDELDYFDRLLTQCNPDLVCTPLTGDFQYICGNDLPQCNGVIPPPEECVECVEEGDCRYCLVDEDGNLVFPPDPVDPEDQCIEACPAFCDAHCEWECMGECDGPGECACETLCKGDCPEFCLFYCEDVTTPPPSNDCEECLEDCDDACKALCPDCSPFTTPCHCYDHCLTSCPTECMTECQ